jgi:hypothetical protein
MDFPTALRYLMAGRTIRRESEWLEQNFKVGTIHDACTEKQAKTWKNGPAVICFWPRFPENAWFARFDSDDVLATDWELVE